MWFLALIKEDCPMPKMTTEEAFVKVLQMHGIEHAFGIIGSAMMPVSDLFPESRHHLLGLCP
jgi:thiamine pyrophosphate-dependent acetolactate synthase large subunit-like protein